MELTFKPLKVRPPEWEATRPKVAQFEATYRDTLELLDRELRHLNTEAAFLQVELSDPVRGVRIDGQLRADAVATHRGCILTIATRKLGTLVYPCDTFVKGYRSKGPDWQQNLRAIALGLEALRKVERYGIASRGEQYAGFRELGAGTEMGGGEPMGRDEVAAFLATAAGLEYLDPDDQSAVRAAYREASMRHHPDHGGNHAMMAYLNTARDVLLPDG